MATKTVSQKESERADVEFNTGKFKMTKRNKRKVKKSLNSVGAKVIALALVLLVVGVAAGIGTYYLVCKNDCFNIIGQEEITLTLDEAYKDEGVNIVAFGKNVGDSVTIDTNLKTDADGNYYANEIGTYFIRYSSTNFKYGSVCKIQKIRLITFVEASEGGE